MPGPALPALRRALAAAALVLFALAAGCGGGSQPRGGRVAGDTLVVYLGAPLHGVARAAGQDVVAGAQLALAEAGERVGRFALRLRVLDAVDRHQTAWTPARVAENARRAARDPRTIAYLGEVDPTASAVSVVILNQGGILQVSPTDTFAGLTEREGTQAGEPEKYYPARDRTFARLIVNDDRQAGALADLMVEQGVGRLLLLHDRLLYGKSLADQTAAEARARGIKVVDEQPVDVRATDLRARIAALAQQDRPDAVLYASAMPAGAARLWSALHLTLPRARLFAPGGLAVASFYSRLAPGAAAATTLTSPMLPARRYGAVGARFGRDFGDRYGRPPGAWAAYGYEAMAALIAAIRRAGAGARTRRELISSFFATRRPASPIGRYAITPRGDTTRREIGVYRPDAGHLRLLRVEVPAE